MLNEVYWFVLMMFVAGNASGGIIENIPSKTVQQTYSRRLLLLHYWGVRTAVERFICCQIKQNRKIESYRGRTNVLRSLV